MCDKPVQKVIKYGGDLGVLDNDVDLVIFDRKDWRQPNGPFTMICAMLDVPKCAKLGKRITFLNSAAQTNMIRQQHKCSGGRYGSFWHIMLTKINQSVTIEFANMFTPTGPLGWIVVEQVGDVFIHTLNQQPTSYIYTICTIQGIPNSPGVTDFVATLVTNKADPQYGGLPVDISWGSDSKLTMPDGTPDPSVGYHHGGIVSLPNGQSNQDDEYPYATPSTFLAANGLRWNNGATPLGGSIIDFHHLISDKHPNRTSTALARQVALAGADAIHTIHANPFTSNLLISYLGTPGTTPVDEPSSGPGGFAEVSTQLLFPNNPLQVTNYFTLPPTGPGSLPGTQDNWQYDFQINPCTGILVSTSWSSPKGFADGFDPVNESYGTSVRVIQMPLPYTPNKEPVLVTWFNLEPATLTGGQSIIPLEVRKVHQPMSEIYFIGGTLTGALFVLYYSGKSNDHAGWELDMIVSPQQLIADCKRLNDLTDSLVPDGAPLFPPSGLRVPLLTDITLSGDDYHVYGSCWLSGALVQYDVSEFTGKPPKCGRNPRAKLVGGRGNLGGITVIESFVNHFNTNSVKITNPNYGTVPVQFCGGPQMLRLSVNSEEIYVTNSLYPTWDTQFYAKTGPGSIDANGGQCIKLLTGVKKGVKKEFAELEIDESFFTNFGNISGQLPVPEGGGAFVTMVARPHEQHILGVSH